MPELYFSWIQLLWHKSKDVLEWVDMVNGGKETQAGPLVDSPLPSNSQFLNVIESVFSGLAKAVITIVTTSHARRGRRQSTAISESGIGTFDRIRNVRETKFGAKS